MAVNEIIIDSTEYVNPVKTSDDFEVANYYGILANGQSHHFTDTEMRTVHNMLSKWGQGGLTENMVLDNFNRFYTVFPDMEMPTDLKSYIFITRPEMNLLSDNGSTYRANGDASLSVSADNGHDSRLQYMAALHPEILYMLCEDFSAQHQFIPYLQGRAESLQLPDYQIRTSEFAVPFYSYKFTYPTVTNESITGGTFEITFREDSELRITKMFQFWIYYMDAVIKNKMSPTREHIIGNYYDFMCSVYEIVCDPTSQKILFWAKYTGCFPTSVPLSGLSHNLGNGVDSKVPVSFSYMMVEAMEPRVIEDFNRNAAGASGTPEPVYDEDFGVIGETLVGVPQITLSSDKHGLLLQWYPRITNGASQSISRNVPVLDNIAIANDNVSSYYTQQASTSRSTVSSIVTQSPLSSWLTRNTDSLD